jgi:hypothetical protein
VLFRWKLVKDRFVLILSLVILLPTVGFAHTIAELNKDPTTFDQQPVSVVGKVTNLVTRYGGTPYTTFDLVDAEDSALPVLVTGTPKLKQGDLCHVTGLFVQEQTVGTYVLTRGIQAEKVEKVADAKYKTAGQLFGKKPGSRNKDTNTYPRGFYPPLH